MRREKALWTVQEFWEGRKGWGSRGRKDLIFQMEEGQLFTVTAGGRKAGDVWRSVCFVSELKRALPIDSFYLLFQVGQ